MPTTLLPRQRHAGPDQRAAEEHAQRMLVNLLVMIGCVLFIGGGLYIVEGLHRAAKIEACVEAGRKVCHVSGSIPASHSPGGVSPLILPGVSGARP